MQTVRQKKLGEVKYRPEMAWLELEGTADITDAFFIARDEVVQGRALVPCLREIREVPHQPGKARFRDIVSAGRNVASRQIEDLPCLTVRVVHPKLPDSILRLGCERRVRARGKTAKELIQDGQAARGPPIERIGDQAQRLRILDHLR